jgi:hypothetical protein
MAQAASNKKNYFTSISDLGPKKKLIKCYILSMDLYGACAWTLRQVDHNYLESLEMWCWERMEKISWTHDVKHAEGLSRIKEERNILYIIKKEG